MDEPSRRIFNQGLLARPGPSRRLSRCRACANGSTAQQEHRGLLPPAAASRRLAVAWPQQGHVHIVDKRAGAAGRRRARRTIGAFDQAAKSACGDATVPEGFDQIGMEQVTMTPREYVAWMAGGCVSWRPVVQASGFRSED
jgi:hypothetical protein